MRVHYDPRDPTRAVIYPGPPWSFTALMALPLALVGLALGLVRWVARRTEANLAGLIVWPILFLGTTTVVAGLLPPLCVSVFGRTSPWWCVPLVYGVAFLSYAMPSAMNYPPLRQLSLAIVAGVAVVMVAGLVVVATTDHRAAFGAEWNDEELVAKLDAEHPGVAEHAARTVMRREGPREAAIEDPANAEIRDTLLSTQKNLSGYLWAREQVEHYRHQLRHDESVQARYGAAFSLGRLGEVAVIALPDLETAAGDPRNHEFAKQLAGVIEKLQRYRP